MTYEKLRVGRKKKASTGKITREDIEKAMKEFKGEIQHLKIEKSLFHEKQSDEAQPPRVSELSFPPPLLDC